MQVTSNEIRTRMASLSSEKLEYIVSAMPGDYTEEAIAAARDELASRPVERPTDSPEGSRAQSSWSVGESFRSLATLILTWVGWVCVLTCVRLFLNPSGIIVAFAFACLAVAAFWLARRLSASWRRRLLVVVPLVIGMLYVVRAAFSSEPAERLFTGAVLLIGGSLVAAVLRARRRHTVQETAG